MMRRLTPAALLFFALAVPAFADQAFDDCVRRLCTSIVQKNCWVKGGAAICDEDQLQCISVPDHAPATVIQKKGGRWQVLTRYAQGWVSERAMMVDGGECGY